MTSFYLFCPNCQRAYSLPKSFQEGVSYSCPQCHRPLMFRSRAGETTHSSSRWAEEKKSTRIKQVGLQPGGRVVTETGEILEVLSLLGQGGGGVVYEVRDTFLRRSMALKVLRQSKIREPIAVRRFLREIYVTSHLEHPNIIPVYGGGKLRDGSFFLLMKKVSGDTLKAFLEATPEGRRLPLRRSLEVFLKVCDALQYAHSKGVIHRDLKPSNIAIGAFGEVLVMDWGLAKLVTEEEEKVSLPPEVQEELQEDLSLTGGILGTPAYMPPEQARGDSAAVGPQSDIYSLGAVLYHILTLSPPFQGNPREMLTQLLLKDPTPPRQRKPSLKIPRELDAICMKAMAKRPEERYQSVEELAEEIQNYLEDQPIKVYTPSLSERVIRWSRRHAHILTPALLILVVVAIFGYALALESERRSREHQKTIELQKKALKAEQDKERLYREKLAAEQARLKEQQKLLALQKQKEEFHKRQLKAYSPFILARNLMANNLRYKHLEKNVVPLLKKALEIHPQFVEARLELIRVYIYLNYRPQILQQIILFAQNLPVEEGEEGKKLEATFQKFYAAFMAGGKISPALMKELVQARPSFIHPVYWNYLQMFLLFLTGQSQELLQLAERLSQKKESMSWEIVYMKGVALGFLGRHREAVTVFKELIDRYPHISFLYTSLALAYRRLGKWQQSFQNLLNAVYLDPTNPFNWGVLGNTLYLRAKTWKSHQERTKKLHNFLDAYVYLSYAVELGRNSSYAAEFQPRLRLAMRAFRVKSQEELAHWVAKAFPAVTDSSSVELQRSVALLLVYLWVRLKDPALLPHVPKAMSMLEKYLKLFPMSLSHPLIRKLLWEGKRELHQGKR